jgi:hypothetical protein
VEQSLIIKPLPMALSNKWLEVIPSFNILRRTKLAVGG